MMMRKTNGSLMMPLHPVAIADLRAVARCSGAMR
jgi:hypothetical protein